MRDLIRAELISLRTLRSTWAVLAFLVLAGVGIVIGDFSEAGAQNLDTFGELRENLVRDAGLLGAVAMALFAATRVGGEYRYGTIAQRVLGAPRRRRLVAAKLAVFGVLGSALGALTGVLAVPAAEAMASSKGMTFNPGAGDVLTIVAEVAAGVGLFAVIGAAVAFITRSQPVAILVLLGAFVAEEIVMGIAGSVGQYLPYQLLNSTLDAGSLAPATGAVALAAVAVAVTAAGVSLLRTRDIT
jgi:hypothetical protein